MLLPGQVSLATFDEVKGVLERAEVKYVKRYHVCPNDCIVYYDSLHLPEPHKHAHRSKYVCMCGCVLTKYICCRQNMIVRGHIDLVCRHILPTCHRTACRCPKCGEGRYVVDPTDNTLKPAKVFFHFPVGSYIRALFARPDVVPHLYHDLDGRPESHTTRSRGFKQKVLDNPHMNTDHRNLGLVGTTDGVPFFDDQRRGHNVCVCVNMSTYHTICQRTLRKYPHIASQCPHDIECVGAWPFILRCANLPDTLSMHMSNCHLHLLSANEYWKLDKSAGVLRRRIHAPKSLRPHLTVIVDDLLHAYSTGHSSRHFPNVCCIHCSQYVDNLTNLSTYALHCRQYHTMCQHYVKPVDI